MDQANIDVQTAAQAVAGPVVDALGCELVAVEFTQKARLWYLTFYIDKPGGLTVEDCEAASQALDPLLDQDPVVAGRHDHLIVSSPGLDRPLTTDRDFQRKINTKIEVKLREALEGKSMVTGLLADADSRRIVLTMGKKTLEVPREQIEWAKQAIDMTWRGES